MSENPNTPAEPVKPVDNPHVEANKTTNPPAQPAQNVPAGVNAGSPAPAAPAPKPEEKALAPVNSYIPGGLNREVVNPVPNPAQADDNFPFSAGHKIHEIAQYQNFFTYPLDTYYNIFDAIYYFSDEKNRNRYTYEQQQII